MTRDRHRRMPASVMARRGVRWIGPLLIAGIGLSLVPTAATAVVAPVSEAGADASAPITGLSQSVVDTAQLASAAAVPGLLVKIAGLPKGINARVVVTGPKQTRAGKAYRKAVTATTKLPRLAAGTYTITAAAIPVLGTKRSPKVTKAIVKVTAKAVTTYTVTYSLPKSSVPPKWDLKVSPNPIKVKVGVGTDKARSVSKLIPLTGGVLTTKGADGVTYTLTVPGNALTSPTTITMTPIVGSLGVPIGQASYGVKLEPEGLRFMNFAQLKVAPASGMTWPVKNQIPIGVDGVKRTVGLAPLVKTSAVPIFQILHFSYYSVLLANKGFNAEITKEVRKRLGGDQADRIFNAISQQLAVERERALLGGIKDTVSIAQLLNDTLEFADTVLKQRIAAAGTSCAAGTLAVQDLLGLERQFALLGAGSFGEATGINVNLLVLGSLGDVVAEVCYREEYEICRDEHIVTRFVPRVLGLYRQYALLGVPNASGQSIPALRSANKYMHKCLQFEVRVDSRVTVSESDFPRHTTYETISTQFKVGYPLGIDLVDYVFFTDGQVNQGLGQWKSTEYSGTYSEPCHQSSNYVRFGGTVGGGLGFSSGKRNADTPEGDLYVKDFSLSLVFGPAASGVSNYQLVDTTGAGTACDGSPDQSMETEGWWTKYLPVIGERFAEPRGMTITKWNVTGNNDLMATKNISVNVSPDSPTETISGPMNLVLFHKPL